MTKEESKSKNYFPALDGLRGVMAVGVVGAHIQISWFPGAPNLMELFFVISGFLITAIILRTINKTGKVGLINFWKRRLMRLYPVMLVVVLSTLCAAWWLLDDRYMSGILRDAVATIFYYSNWTKLYDYFLPTMYGQSWSLSIEEQFYLIWPVLFSILVALRLRRFQILTLLVVLALASMLWRYYLIYDGAPWSRLYYALETRMDAFVVGGILALSFEKLLVLTQSKSWDMVLNLCALGLLVLLATGSFHDINYFKWRQTLVLLLTAATILLISSPRDGLLKRFFCMSWFMFLGRRSYSIYLWHWPIIWLLYQTTDYRDSQMALVVVPLTLLLSSLSYSFVEIRFLSQKRRGQILTPMQRA